MTRKILGWAAGAALLALGSTPANAHTDVWLGVHVGIPTPWVVVDHAPAFYYEYEPATVHYHEYREYPRTYVVERRYETRRHVRPRHDRSGHRGHHGHH